MKKKRQEEIKEAGRRRRRRGKERRRRKKGEELFAVFVSGRRIGQNFSYEASCCLCFGTRRKHGMLECEGLFYCPTECITC